MKEKEWNDKGKIFFGISIVVFLFGMITVLNNFNNVVNNSNNSTWFLIIIWIVNCIIFIWKSLKIKERYTLYAWIMLLLTWVLFNLIPKLMYYIKA